MDREFSKKNELRSFKRPPRSPLLFNRLMKKIKKMNKISLEEQDKKYFNKKLEISINLEKYLGRFDENMSINEENIIYLMKKLDDDDYTRKDQESLNDDQQNWFKDFFLSLMKQEDVLDIDYSEEEFLDSPPPSQNKKIRNSKNFL
jgi:hypothetical protein